MKTEIEILTGHKEIDGCRYVVKEKLVVKPIIKENWTYETKRKCIWTIPEDIHIPSTHDSRFSAKKGITAIFQYDGYKTITPLSPTVKLFVYKGLDPHEGWTLVLLDRAVSTQVTKKDIETYEYGDFHTII